MTLMTALIALISDDVKFYATNRPAPPTCALLALIIANRHRQCCANTQQRSVSAISARIPNGPLTQRQRPLPTVRVQVYARP